MEDVYLQYFKSSFTNVMIIIYNLLFEKINYIIQAHLVNFRLTIMIIPANFLIKSIVSMTFYENNITLNHPR